jgi:hypothetical protein
MSSLLVNLFYSANILARGDGLGCALCAYTYNRQTNTPQYVLLLCLL